MPITYNPSVCCCGPPPVFSPCLNRDIPGTLYLRIYESDCATPAFASTPCASFFDQTFTMPFSGTGGGFVVFRARHFDPPSWNGVGLAEAFIDLQLRVHGTNQWGGGSGPCTTGTPPKTCCFVLLIPAPDNALAYCCPGQTTPCTNALGSSFKGEPDHALSTVTPLLLVFHPAVGGYCVKISENPF